MDGGQAVTAVIDALRGRGIVVDDTPARGDIGYDLILEPGSVRLQVTYRSLVDQASAAQLLTQAYPPPGVLLLVVGDRITAAARRILLEHGAGYYDLRGHVAVRTTRLVVDTDVDPLMGPRERNDPLAGTVGLQVAAALLVSPASGAPVRQLARSLDRSPSTVSSVLKALRRDDLIDDRQHVIDTRLFWQVADRWPRSRTYLSEQPPPTQESRVTAPLRLGLTEPEHSVGWALTDTAAAVVYQAPLAVRSDQMIDFYVPDQITLRRAEQLLGVASSPSQAACAVRVAPVPAVCSRRVDVETNPYRWPLANPVFVALDLAQDIGRGREILDEWTPPERWRRVW